MGAQNSSLRRVVEDEYERLRSEKRDYLVLSELLQLRLPSSSWTVDPAHLGVLFVLDSNKNGRFTKDKLFAFVEYASQRAQQYSPYEYKRRLHGACTAQMWTCISAGNGKAVLVNWLTSLFSENGEVEVLRSKAGKVQCVGWEAVVTMHSVLEVKEVLGLDFQAFLDLLQRVAEERGLLDLQNKDHDDFVPVQVLAELAASLHEGIARFVADIFPPAQQLEQQQQQGRAAPLSAR